MDWIPLKLSDQGLFDERLKTYPIPLSDYTFTNFWMWNSLRHYQYILFEEWLCTKFTLKGQEILMMPIGPEMTRELIQALAEGMAPFKMRAVDEGHVKTIIPLAPPPVTLIVEEDRFDYLYDFNQLKTLTGNDLQPKRNFVHQFEEAYGNAYQPITAANLPLVMHMQREWIGTHHPDVHLLDEHRAIMRALENFAVLHLEGGCLVVDGQVIAYTFAEMLTKDTLVIHAEKALTNYKGAYQTINQQFLIHQPETRYVNREEALGIPALEHAKHSYHPIELIKKFRIEGN